MNTEKETSEKVQPAELLECDIVMAGGVTSGIIYPGAVAMISRRYSFKSIGGTSVGAIAAAITAAAEYGRRTGSNPNAFASVAEIPRKLGETARDGHSRLFHLFTSEPATGPLLALVAPIFSAGGRLARTLRVLKAGMSSLTVAVPMLLAAVCGIFITVELARSGEHLLSAVAILMTASLLLVVWTATVFVSLARRWLPDWRMNGYGICTGLSSPTCGGDPDASEFEGLTRWAHRNVQIAAGRKVDGPPLTFGELWSAPLDPKSKVREANPVAPRTIELAMIASDISRNRSVQLPFLETPSPLYFEVSVLERYFPPSVVHWMIDNAGKYDSRVERREGIYRLPWPQNLPIIFAARLSLSFPVLLSALPLLTPDFAKGRAKDGRVQLRRAWFSDGGLTSNFPIHFFDSPIPTRPTFCLNLIDFDAGTPTVELAEESDEVGTDASPAVPDVGKPISEPRSAQRTAAERPQRTEGGDPKPRDPIWGFISMAQGNSVSPVPFTAFDSAPGVGLGSFFSTLLNTARFWSDNQMIIAPGIRDRVVNIALRDDEGGLNLDMSSRVIDDLDLRGRAAGLLISARFDPNQVVDPETGQRNEQTFPNHRWVRYRNFMASFEDVSRRFALSRRGSDEAAQLRRESPLADMIAGKAVEKLGYPAPKAAIPYYRTVTSEFEALALKMAASTAADENATFDRPRSYEADQVRRRRGGAPRPVMRGRLRPLADNDPRAEAADLPTTVNC